MIIAITSTGETLESDLDPRFGRARCFLLIDPETNNFRAITNPNIEAVGGAGIQSAQLVAGEGAEVVITGSCGPNAFDALSAAGVRVYTGASGTIEHVLEEFNAGRLKSSRGPDVASHSGMARGRGHTLGVGSHLGRGKFAPEGGPTEVVTQPKHKQAPDEELEVLKERVKLLQEEMQTVLGRIRELENRGQENEVTR
jgi:predicted Fe-Mo cluster-binding NifX family protein